MLNYIDYILRLQKAFQQPLPGFQVQMQMGRRNVQDHRFFQEVPEDAIKSAVLIVFYPDAGKVCLPLIVRPEYNGVHSGQTALPGGRWEPTDESLYQTALREANEEIGLDTIYLNYLGALTPLYIPPSHFIVHPFVAYMNFKPDLTRDETEVKQIIEANWADFFQEENIKYKVFRPSIGGGIEAYYFDVAGREIWGATAMMLNELRAMC